MGWEPTPITTQEKPKRAKTKDAEIPVSPTHRKIMELARRNYVEIADEYDARAQVGKKFEICEA